MKLRTRHAALALVLVGFAGLGAAYHASGAPARAQAQIVAAAEAFIGTLDENGRAKALWTFEDEERFNWNFVPIARSGLPLKEMTLEQRSAAFALLQSVLSSQGFLKATGVIRLEEILGILEERQAMRDPENYFFWVFGTPSTEAPWGWRFEGHHISLSFTSARGLTVNGPAFIGANPARVASGPHAGWRLLGAEEDLARALVRSLSAEQRATAVIAEDAPGDIITGRDREAVLERTEGLAASAMTGEQRQLFLRLLAEYVDNVEPGIAAARRARIDAAGIDRLHFAWAGSLEPGERHYYRIHGPTLLVEYDNTQNAANHIHSVFRDLENDFGEDLLRTHYERADGGHGHDHGPGTHTHEGGSP
jgi:hypothetical protein